MATMDEHLGTTQVVRPASTATTTTYASAAERQRAYRRRKAKEKSDEWVQRIGRDPATTRQLTASDYGRIGNAAKRLVADERRRRSGG